MRKQEKTQFDDLNIDGFRRRWVLVAWRGRCSHGGKWELLNCTRILQHQRYTFTVYLALHCEVSVWISVHSHFQLFIMNPDRWRMALKLQPSLTSTLLCFNMSKHNKPIKTFLERENKGDQEPGASFVDCLSWCSGDMLRTPQTTGKRDGRPRALTWDSSHPRLLHLAHFKGLHSRRYFQTFTKSCMYL